MLTRGGGGVGEVGPAGGGGRRQAIAWPEEAPKAYGRLFKDAAVAVRTPPRNKGVRVPSGSRRGRTGS